MDASTTSPATPDLTAELVFGAGGGRLNADELEALTKALSELVVPMNAAWTELLGQEVEVSVGAVRPGPSARPPDAEPDPTASILDGVSDPDASIAIGAFGGELATIALIVPTSLGLVVVDLLLGGSGRPTGERTLSAIDLDLLQTVTAPTFAAVRRLGPPDRFDEPVPELHDLEEPELVARLAGGTIAEITITVGEHAQPLLLLLGAPAARHLAGAVNTGPSDAPTEQSRALLRSVLADVVVEAVVTFPTVLVPSHRVIGLDIGDVIALGAGTDQPLPLRVDGLHLADVRPARAGADVACQIVSTTVGNPHHPHPFSSAPGGVL